MRIFLDTEFYERGGRVDLISIGLVREDGKELYALSPHIDKIKRLAAADPDQWVYNNVLRDEVLYVEPPVVPNSMNELATMVTDFCGLEPTFWGYIIPYDSVVFKSCIYGRMIDAPDHHPYSMCDLALPLKLAGKESSRDFPPLASNNEAPEHVSVCDSRWNKRVYDTLLRDAKAGLYGKTSQSIVDVLLAKPR